MSSPTSGTNELIAPVKSVDGDSVTFYLKGAANSPILPERTLRLANIDVPKFSSHLNHTDDAYISFMCREFMRKQLAGGRARFVRDFSANGQDFGTAYPIKDNRSLSLMAVENGFASVSKKANRPSPELDALLAAETKARKSQVGMWSPTIGANAMYIIDDDKAIQKFASEHKGKLLNGIVEQVRNGCFMKVFFSKEGVVADVAISGIICDGSRRQEDGTVLLEEFTQETKHFVELRLLQRDVEIRIDGSDDYGTLFGTVMREGRDIGLRLVEIGLAKLHEGRMRLLQNPGELRRALRSAQQERLGRWRNWQPATRQESEEYQARVTEVPSGDSLMVKPLESDGLLGAERRLYLASIRCPRLGGRFKPDEPYAYEAKEFVRGLAIGKRVLIKIVSMREPAQNAATGAQPPPSSDSQGRMHFVTAEVLEGHQKVDIGCAVALEGFCRVMSSNNSEENSPHIDKLFDNESTARAAKANTHSSETYKPVKINQLLGVENSGRAEAFLSELQKRGRMEGVVEYCFSAAMFKIRINSMGIAVRFHIGGLDVPQTARPPQVPADQPLAMESMDYTKERLMQRSVQIEVEACERSGTFIGSLYHNKEVFAKQLLQVGYAKLLTGTQVRARMRMRSEMEPIEREARKTLKGVWSLQEAEDEDSNALAEVNNARLIANCKCVHVSSIRSFFIQEKGRIDPATFMDDVQRAAVTADRYSRDAKPRRGDTVLARYSLDKSWYRATVNHVEDDRVDVLFIDYGNEETVSIHDLLRCPINLATSRVPALAMRCALTGLRDDVEASQDAAEFLDHNTCGSGSADIVLQVEKRVPALKNEPALNEVILFLNTPVSSRVEHKLLEAVAGTVEDNKVADAVQCCMNLEIVRHGLALVDRKGSSGIKSVLLKAQDAAKKERLKLWKHGDVEDVSDDEAFPALR